jgi:signal transduction histidine kinase
MIPSKKPTKSEHPGPIKVDCAEDLKGRTPGEDLRLSALFEIAGIFAAEQDLDTVLGRLLTCLVETLEAAEAGIVFLHNPSDDRLEVRATYGYDLSRLRLLRLAPGEAMWGRTFQTGEPHVYRSTQAIAKSRRNLTPENLKVLRRATIGIRHSQSAVCIPLFTGDTKIGVLMLENLQQPESFVEPDLTFLQAVADLVAPAVENARLRRELQTSHALEEANRLKGELLSTLAHEMRTPLTSIKGYCTALLLEETSFDPGAQREFLEIIDEECDTLESLVHDLLESSIIDAGLLRLELQPVMLPHLSRVVIDEIARRADRHRFVIDFADNFPIVDADPDRIAQVLRNLLDNAVKYSPDGRLVILRGESGENEVIVSVADQGVGILPENLNRLFERFFRVDSGLGRHVVGSGLGLPICRMIVEAHGGRIWAESKMGQGSTFYFTLPVDGISQEVSEPEGEAAR